MIFFVEQIQFLLDATKNCKKIQCSREHKPIFPDKDKVTVSNIWIRSYYFDH